LSNVIYFSDEEDAITNVAAAKSFEVEGVKAAESGDLDKAIGLFTRAINIAPEWASGYNNRAQAYRLKGDTAGMRTVHCPCLEAFPSHVTQCASLRPLSVLSTNVFSTREFRLVLGPPTFLLYQHVVFFMCVG
jgi:hypothetical protein